MTRSRPVLLFDVMDTLVADPARDVVLRFFGLDRETFVAAKSEDAYLRFERGAISEAEFARSYFVDGRGFDVEGLKAMLRENYRWIEGIPDLLADLREVGVEMHAMSNYSRWSSMIDDALGVSQYLPWTFVSWKTGLRKPDPEAYRHAARALGRPPADCLFVDDRATNVRGAEAVGMPGLRFRDAAQLREALRARGLLK